MTTVDPRWKRFAYVAVEDAACRTGIVRVLEVERWCVEERATGYHVIQDLCDLIAGEHGRAGPGLIAVDAHARGCSGLTIARGFCELGVTVPVVVISKQRIADQTDRKLIVAEPSTAADTVARLIRRT